MHTHMVAWVVLWAWPIMTHLLALATQVDATGTVTCALSGHKLSFLVLLQTVNCAPVSCVKLWADQYVFHAGATAREEEDEALPPPPPPGRERESKEERAERMRREEIRSVPGLL